MLACIIQTIFRFSAAPAPVRLCAAEPKPTWARNIAPLIYRHCASCHHEGQPVPFSLLTYQDVRLRGPIIARVIATRYMPPWLPARGYGRFMDANNLTAAEINTVARWAASGFPEGDERVAPPPPTFRSSWELGPPDAVLHLDQPVRVPAEGPDQYRCFVIATSFEQDRFVRAFQFMPDSAAKESFGSLHHALLFVDTRRQTSLPSNYDCFGTPGFIPTSGLGGWTPGQRAVSMPPGTAVSIPRNARLVVQLHFHPTGKPNIENPSIGLYFGAKPVRALMDVPLVSNRIDILSGDPAYVVTDHFDLPVPVEVVGVIPHAHYLCRDIKAWAVLPNGRKKWLLWIPHWNFDWQEQYRYAQPFWIPAGTQLRMEFTYDNSAGNVRNPNHPPERVRWGPGTTDEMAGVHLQVIPRNDADMHELGQAEWGKLMRSVGGFFPSSRPSAQ